MLAKTIDQNLPAIVSLLDSIDIDYWLARGVLRNLYLTGDVGNKNSDIDFHIWEKDKQKVKDALEPMLTSSYKDLEVEEKNYKLAFYTPEKSGQHDFFVEFMFLYNDENDQYVYHCRADGKRYSRARCFDREHRHFIRHNAVFLRIPAFTNEYLFGTYGPEWQRNLKESKKFTSTPKFLEKYEGAQ